MAWIEITPRQLISLTMPVATSVVAWIEIGTGFISQGAGSVATSVVAWIEINFNALTPEIGVSPLA